MINNDGWYLIGVNDGQSVYDATFDLLQGDLWISSIERAYIISRHASTISNEKYAKIYSNEDDLEEILDFDATLNYGNNLGVWVKLILRDREPEPEP